jgi:mRNA interferase RelE/StbE
MPASYSVFIKRSAEKELRALGDSDRRRCVEAIRGLASNPRPAGCERLSGRDAWRIRVGASRIVYSIEDAVLTVEVVKVGHRREVYR